MSVLNLGNDAPGIVGPMLFRPETAAPLTALAEALLSTNDHGLSQFERELIATYVSAENRCEFCSRSHAWIAAEVAGNVRFGPRSALEWIWFVVSSPDTALEEGELSPHVYHAFNIAWYVVRNTPIPDGVITAARDAGLSDEAIHDAALIAAAFSMFNRYVEAVGNPPASPEQYKQSARRIAEHGYRR